MKTLSGRMIEVLDMAADDWQADGSDRLAQAVKAVKEKLPNVRRIISEPGKEVEQPSQCPIF